MCGNYLPLINKGSRDDVLSITTMLQAGRSVLIPGGGQEILSSKHPDGLWGPPSLLFIGYWEAGGGLSFCG